MSENTPSEPQKTPQPQPAPVFPPPPHQSPAPRQGTRLGTMTIATIVSAILGWTMLPTIGSIVALILAPMAKKEIQGSNGSLNGEEFVKIAWIASLINVILVAGLILLTIVIPLLFAGVVLNKS